MKRTAEEIAKQIEGLEKTMAALPARSAFGDDNHGPIKAQIAILKGSREYTHYEEAAPDIERAAYDADQWLNNSEEGDLFNEDDF